MVKKNEDTFIRFDRMYEHDRQTNTAWRHRLRLCILLSGKSHPILMKLGTQMHIWISTTARWPNMNIFQYSRWRMAAILKIVFGHNLAPDCPTSLKFRIGKQNSITIELRGHMIDIESIFRKFKMADGRHIANRKIAISWLKIIRFWWNLVHKCRFGTRWSQIAKYENF